MLEVGKLYQCKDYLLLYPDPDTAARAMCIALDHAPASDAAHWSTLLGKPVFYTEKNIPLLVLNSKEKYIEVLAGDKTGWIVCNKWLKIKEIK